jgi:hypothetical protein
MGGKLFSGRASGRSPLQEPPLPNPLPRWGEGTNQTVGFVVGYYYVEQGTRF